MKTVLHAISTVFAIGLLAWHFTLQPVEASQEMLQVEKGLFMEVLEDNKQLKERVNALTGVTMKLYWRLEAVEAKNKISIPPELKIEVKK